MAIILYRDQPFSVSTECDLIDTFLGNGIDDTFTLVNKSGSRVASTVQAGNIQFLRYNGGFTVSGNNVTLSEIPLNGSQGVIPGLNCLTFTAFDVSSVSGVTNPLVSEVAFYIGNSQDIYLEYYTGLDPQPGMKLQFSTEIAVGGADTSWFQLASSTQDLAGVAATYQATGAPLYADPIESFATLTLSAAALATTLNISSNSDTWYTGDYILINPGGGNSEIVKMVGQSGTPASTLTTTGLNFSHSIGEPVFACARKFWGQMVVPEGAASGIAQNYISVSLNLVGQSNPRL